MTIDESWALEIEYTQYEYTSRNRNTIVKIEDIICVELCHVRISQDQPGSG